MDRRARADRARGGLKSQLGAATRSRTVLDTRVSPDDPLPPVVRYSTMAAVGAEASLLRPFTNAEDSAVAGIRVRPNNGKVGWKLSIVPSPLVGRVVPTTNIPTVSLPYRPQRQTEITFNFLIQDLVDPIEDWAWDLHADLRPTFSSLISSLDLDRQAGLPACSGP